MKTIFCIFVGILTFVFPTKRLKKFCSNLADKTYIVSNPNKNNLQSYVIQVFENK